MIRIAPIPVCSVDVFFRLAEKFSHCSIIDGSRLRFFHRIQGTFSKLLFVLIANDHMLCDGYDRLIFFSCGYINYFVEVRSFTLSYSYMYIICICGYDLIYAKRQQLRTLRLADVYSVFSIGALRAVCMCTFAHKAPYTKFLISFHLAMFYLFVAYFPPPPPPPPLKFNRLSYREFRILRYLIRSVYEIFLNTSPL